MKIKILKGTNEIGGSCVELKTKNTTILIDYGKPLSDDSKQVKIMDKIDGVLISHPHQDHFGEIGSLDKNITIHCGKLSEELMNSTRIFLGENKFENKFDLFKAWEKITIGDFTIVPYLVDHSASDAYTFLIEAEGQKVIYSGDFRNHGRKKEVFSKMLVDEKVKNVDALIIEGTMIDRINNKFPTEESVENEISRIMKKNNQISFIICSSQNIDTLVSAYNACKRNGKIFVVDIYTAWILEKLKIVSDRVPNMNWDNVKVLKKFGGSNYEKLIKNKEFFGQFQNEVFKPVHIIELEEVKKNPAKFFFKIATGHIQKVIDEINLEKADIIYSQWLGYLKKEYSKKNRVDLFKNLKEKYDWHYAHTSGHADLPTLKVFAEALNPKRLIPIHTEHKEEFKKHFKNVLVLDDGESLNLGKKREAKLK